KRKSEYVVGPPKSNAGYRKIPMMNSVRNAVLEEKEMQKALGLESRMTIDGYSGFIFLNRFGDIYNDQSLNRALNRICNTYNAKEEIRAKKSRRPPVMLPHITNHILRHTFCARFCEKETNLKVIQTVMGHDDITTTMNIYAEVSEGFKKETFSRLADNFEIFKERGKASIS
ncbi:MAG: tyrosine-type recombinase/integrase, partial [Lachnospiraceae bacterium]|nr:tyrosine-type recombinase/integrase [Lachnospiraceae bacterium]